MHIANEFQAMLSNIGTEFRSSSGLLPEDFDQIRSLSKKTRLRKIKRNEIINMEEKNSNISSYSKLEIKQKMFYLCINSCLFES